MSELILSIGAARALHLAAQGLLLPRRRKAVKADVLDAIRRMGLLQIVIPDQSVHRYFFSSTHSSDPPIGTVP